MERDSPSPSTPRKRPNIGDIRIVWVDEGADVVWKKCKLSEISKITLHYDRDKDETSATTE